MQFRSIARTFSRILQGCPEGKSMPALQPLRRLNIRIEISALQKKMDFLDRFLAS